jgi:hypothetical protein
LESTHRFDNSTVDRQNGKTQSPFLDQLFLIEGNPKLQRLVVPFDLPDEMQWSSTGRGSMSSSLFRRT